MTIYFCGDDGIRAVGKLEGAQVVPRKGETVCYHDIDYVVRNIRYEFKDGALLPFVYAFIKAKR